MLFKLISKIIIIIFILSSFSHAITKLDDKQMKKLTAQAGISIAINNAVFYKYTSSIKINDLNENNPGYIGLKNITTLTTFDTGNIDVDSDGKMGHINIDIATPPQSEASYSNPYITLSCSDWKTQSFFKAEEIDFMGRNIGSLNITGTDFPKWNLYMGAHNSGIDFEIGFQMKINSFKYNYGDNANSYYFGFSGLQIAQNFNNTDPSNPSVWTANDKFKIGNFENNKPATFDIGIRESDNMPVIYLSAPMNGSVRIENLHIKDQNFGPAAIDGIKVHNLKIELPGRNLGNI